MFAIEAMLGSGILTALFVHIIIKGDEVVVVEAVYLYDIGRYAMNNLASGEQVIQWNFCPWRVYAKH